jgi:nucleotide-binding universal stress UspA family protein
MSPSLGESVHTIAFAAEMTEEDSTPFEHAVALAAVSGARLVTVHALTGPTRGGALLDPGAALARWERETRVDFHEMTRGGADDPVDAVLDALHEIAPNLVVTGTHQRDGVLRALLGSRAEAITANLRVPTLLVPVGSPGFVSAERREIDLGQIVVPVGDPECGQAAVDHAAWLVRLAGVEQAHVTLVHVGPRSERPALRVTEGEGVVWTWRDIDAGPLEDTIVAAAASARLVVMASRGHDSLGDVFRGSHTERVLHRVACPLLYVPVP